MLSLAPSPVALRFERTAQPAALKQWLAAVDLRLQAAPGDRNLMRYRANLLRGLGDFGPARQAYRELAGDEMADRAAAILAGEPLSWIDKAGPVPFALFEGFLDEDQQRRLWETAAGPQASFAPAAVKNTQGVRVDADRQRGQTLRGSMPVKAWFMPHLEALVEREQVLARLGVAPFEIGAREMQVTRHDDGGFLWMHRDSGPANPLRRVTFVYYFHREPRGFEGGDLLLFDQTVERVRSEILAFTRIAPNHNSLIVFPSDRLHAVTRVTGTGSNPLDSRWTVSGWLNGLGG